MYVISSEATQSLSTNAIRFHTILSTAQTTGEDEKATLGNQYSYTMNKCIDTHLWFVCSQDSLKTIWISNLKIPTWKQ